MLKKFDSYRIGPLSIKNKVLKVLPDVKFQITFHR